MIAARSTGNPTIVKSPRKTALEAVFSCRKATNKNPGDEAGAAFVIDYSQAAQGAFGCHPSDVSQKLTD